ncbi:MAG: aldehyde ferredoxin oxidoreductase family protein [Deltaproteobacteria bacterium]|nr:aldehyde ferredoxin oxidoreductase family protein [Deltaproteobacteria bacterium]
MKQVPFFGKIAKVDLTNKSVLTQAINKNVYTKIIGGKGLGAYLLLHNLTSGADPLSPENLLIIANGPLTGSYFPNTSRVELVTKSPQTGTFSDSNAGGYLGRETKATGWDAILVGGRSESLVYLSIRNEKIEFKEASHLAGMDPMSTEDIIRQELGDNRVQVLSIGPAGENMVLLANVATGGRHFGRGGAGAVMGSKNLKAIAVRGTHSLPWNKNPGFRDIAKRAYAKIEQNPTTKKGGKFPSLGTHFTIDVVNSFGVFPTLNWQKSTFPEIEEIWPQDFSNLKIKQLGCYRCPISCRRLSKVTDNGINVLHDGPEYESIYALGANCGIASAHSIVKLDHLCSKYGLDSISTGVTLSFITECYEKGLISKSDLGGIQPAFGDEDGMGKLIEKIAFREGIGNLLSKGTSRAAEEIGGGSVAFAMGVKGLELPGYDPRGMKAMALLYATADRGGCHVRGSSLRSELLGLPQPIDRLSYEGKPHLVAELQKEYALLNSFSICLFANFGLTFEDYTEAINNVFSRKWTLDELKDAGSRVWNLTRLFNCREGFRKKDDTLPARLFFEPLPDGSSQGEVVHREKFDQMLIEYYHIQGWDEDGVPRASTLERLGMDGLI